MVNDLNHDRVKNANYNNASKPERTIHTEEDNSNILGAIKEHQTMQVSPRSENPQDIPDKKRPANSTSSAVLALPVQCKVCEKEIPNKDFLQHCQTNHNIDVLGLPMQCTICEKEIYSKYF